MLYYSHSVSFKKRLQIQQIGIPTKIKGIINILQ